MRDVHLKITQPKKLHEVQLQGQKRNMQVIKFKVHVLFRNGWSNGLG